MWQTSHGDRVLQGDEAIVFMEAVAYLRDMITVAVETNEPYQTGVTIFDALQPTQQLAALHTVVTALFKPDVPAPDLNATLEATVYGVYRELLSLIEIEIDSTRLGDDAYEMRQGLIAGIRCPIVTEDDRFNEFDDLDLRDVPPIDCEDMHVWESEVESFADRVLWDRDFLLDAFIADLDPAKANFFRQQLGIEPHYFDVAAPDAWSAEYQRIDRELVELRDSRPGLFRRDEF